MRSRLIPFRVLWNKMIGFMTISILKKGREILFALENGRVMVFFINFLFCSFSYCFVYMFY